MELKPDDPYNRLLLSNAHPGDWKNPKPSGHYNLVVIGAGTAGLVTAIGAAGLGAKVALIERGLMGGDCLNFGCVPSKAIIQSSRVAAYAREAGRYGLTVAAGDSAADFPAVMERMRRLRARIGEHDAASRCRELGIDLFFGKGRFSSESTAEVDGETLVFKKAVIATGSRAAIPPVDGIERVGVMTNETIFSMTERPSRLAVIGAGPLGCELAQAFCRLGSHVTLFHRHERILNREDVDASRILQQVFEKEGIRLVLGSKLLGMAIEGVEKVIRFERDGGQKRLGFDEILVATGRIPNIADLNLEAAGIAYDTKRGIHVDQRLRTTNPRIYAAGDVCMKYKFTHAADAMARLVIQNALFMGRKRLSSLVIPWCTYTDPEIAHVGMYETDAGKAGRGLTTYMQHLSDVDRAITDGEEEGFVKVHVRKGTGRIIGATVVARHAGEMIGEISLAMACKIGLEKIAGVIHPYPTVAEAIKKVADSHNRSKMTPFIKRLLGLWLSWTR